MPSGKNCLGSSHDYSDLWFSDQIGFAEEMEERVLKLEKDWSTHDKDIRELDAASYRTVVAEKSTRNQVVNHSVGDGLYWKNIGSSFNKISVDDPHMFGKNSTDCGDTSLVISIFATAFGETSLQYEDCLVIIDCEDTVTISKHDCPKVNRYSGTLVYQHLYKFYGVPSDSINLEKYFVTGSADTISGLNDVLASSFLKNASALVSAYRNWPLIKLSREDMCVKDRFLRLNVLLFKRSITVHQVSKLPREGAEDSLYYTSYYDPQILFEGKRYVYSDNDSIDTFFGNFVYKYLSKYLFGVSSSLLVPSSFPVSIIERDFKENIPDLMVPYVGRDYIEIARKIKNSPLPSCDLYHGMHWFLWHDYYIRRVGGLDVDIFEAVSSMNTCAKGSYFHDNCVKVGRNLIESYISIYISKRSKVVDQSYISSIISSSALAIRGSGFHLCWGSFADSGSNMKWINAFLALLGAISFHSPNAVFKILDSIYCDYLDVLVSDRPFYPVNCEARYASAVLNSTGKFIYYKRKKNNCEFYDSLSVLQLDKEKISKKLRRKRSNIIPPDSIKRLNPAYSKYS
jgi:hypothetical protein